MKHDRNKEAGWIEVICGSMFSGKTEELLRRVRRAQFANLSVLLVKPSIETRYHHEEVVSHDNNSMKAVIISRASEILTLADNYRIIAIDEAQFFDNDLVYVCNELANRNKQVIVAGLDKDYQGVAFGPMPQLLANAEYVSKLHAVCSSCGALASFSKRTSKGDAKIELGAYDKYTPLCRACYHASSR